MDKFVIRGGNPLLGTVRVSGAKNAALPCMAAALLTEEPVILENIPQVRDIETTRKLLAAMGAEVELGYGRAQHRTTICCRNLATPEASYELVKTMRASTLVLGPLVARCGRARVSLPGGCAIGARPIDLHIKGLERLGAKITTEHGYVENVSGCDPNHLDALLQKLHEVGVKTKHTADSVRVQGSTDLKAADVITEEYPGFPTDVQAQYMTLATQAEGTSVITENIFENRFMHAQEMVRMGANIKIEGRRAVVQGKSPLSGAAVLASDLRASASLVLAALVADGETIIDRVYHIDRGYENIEEKLRGVGAQIRRIGEMLPKRRGSSGAA
jgi:UDP-N-acetylglucosamine enolpyruvyl transferase